MENNNYNGNNIPSDKLPKSKKNWAWGLVIVLAIALVLGWGGWLGDLFFAFVGGCTALVIGAIIAFLFSRFVNFFERVVLKKAFLNSRYKDKLKRAISLIIVAILIVGFVVLLSYLFIPRIVEIISELINNTDNHLIRIKTELTSFVNNWFGQDVTTTVTDFIDNIVDVVENALQNILPQLLTVSSTVVGAVGTGIFSILFSILMLKDKEKIDRFVTRYTYANNTKQRADEIFLVKKRSSDILYNYFISKFIEVAILAVLTGITYMIIGVPFAWPLAILISIFNFIPYVGVFIGIVPIVLITIIFGTITQALYAILFTLIIFAIVTGAVTPFIIGHKIKVSSLLVGASILIGGAMFGIAGMLFGPPIVAIVSVILMENLEIKEYRKKQIETASVEGINSPDLIEQEVAKITGNSNISTAGYNKILNANAQSTDANVKNESVESLNQVESKTEGLKPDGDESGVIKKTTATKKSTASKTLSGVVKATSTTKKTKTTTKQKTTNNTPAKVNVSEDKPVNKVETKAKTSKTNNTTKKKDLTNAE